MEMKQALELAGLRKERDQLVREKLGVMQTQTVATRLGIVQTLCASLIGPGAFSRWKPIWQAPISRARTTSSRIGSAWITPISCAPKARTAAASVTRSPRASRAARATRSTSGRGAADALTVFADALGDAVRGSGDSLVWTAPQTLSEFLTRPVGQAVSAGHAAWLACLLWLEEAGGALQFAATRTRFFVARPRATKVSPPIVWRCGSSGFRNAPSSR
jgi:two-component system probable response regulator PhcQ